MSNEQMYIPLFGTDSLTPWATNVEALTETEFRDRLTGIYKKEKDMKSKFKEMKAPRYGMTAKEREAYLANCKQRMEEHGGEEGAKFDEDKLRLDLIPPEAMDALGGVLTYGAQKYGDRNWEKGMDYHRPLGAMMRHINAYRMGEELDPESGLPHLDHALASLMFLVVYEKRGEGNNDIVPQQARNTSAERWLKELEVTKDSMEYIPGGKL